MFGKIIVLLITNVGITPKWCRNYPGGWGNTDTVLKLRKTFM